VSAKRKRKNPSLLIKTHGGAKKTAKLLRSWGWKAQVEQRWTGWTVHTNAHASHVEAALKKAGVKLEELPASARAPRKNARRKNVKKRRKTNAKRRTPKRKGSKKKKNPIQHMLGVLTLNPKKSKRGKNTPGKNPLTVSEQAMIFVAKYGKREALRRLGYKIADARKAGRRDETERLRNLELAVARVKKNPKKKKNARETAEVRKLHALEAKLARRRKPRRLFAYQGQARELSAAYRSSTGVKVVVLFSPGYSTTVPWSYVRSHRITDPAVKLGDHVTESGHKRNPKRKRTNAKKKTNARKGRSGKRRRSKRKKSNPTARLKACRVYGDLPKHLQKKYRKAAVLAARRDKVPLAEVPIVWARSREKAPHGLTHIGDLHALEYLHDRKVGRSAWDNALWRHRGGDMGGGKKKRAPTLAIDPVTRLPVIVSRRGARPGFSSERGLIG
jgi:hypothetical protein